MGYFSNLNLQQAEERAAAEWDAGWLRRQVEHARADAREQTEKRAPYDPGKPTAVRMVDESIFECDSFRGEAKSYRVNIETRVCDCPHYAARLAGTEGVCKHYEAAKQQAPFLKALARAKELTDKALDQYLAKYAGHVVIGGALRMEKQARRQEAARRALIGTSTKLSGPLDDDAAFRGGSNWAERGAAK